MRYVAGLVCVVVAAGFVLTALRHRARVLAARRGLPPSEADDGVLGGFGEIVRPLILGVLAYLGLKATLVYLAFDAGQVFSPLDLLGFLAMLAGYGTWLTLRTKHRMPVAVPQPGPAEAIDDESARGRGPLRPDRDDRGLRRRASLGPPRAPLGAPAETLPRRTGTHR